MMRALVPVAAGLLVIMAACGGGREDAERHTRDSLRRADSIARAEAARVAAAVRDSIIADSLARLEEFETGLPDPGRLVDTRLEKADGYLRSLGFEGKMTVDEADPETAYMRRSGLYTRTLGPHLCEISWTEDWFDPDYTGQIRVTIEGADSVLSRFAASAQQLRRSGESGVCAVTRRENTVAITVTGEGAAGRRGHRDRGA